MARLRKMLALSSLFFAQMIGAIQVDIESTDSVKSVAKTIASGMVDYYMNPTTNIIYSNIPGYLPGPYYWWECGAMFGTLIDYWKYTGDTTYNDIVSEGLQFQVGPNQDFMPPNASKWMGNDDQGFWALSAMSAAETNFQNPTGEDAPSWLSLAQAVFNEQTTRWDTTTCNGGMRWQALPVLAGWNLKNTISNGVYFQLGARLARYTGNDSYAQLANRSYEWMERVQLIDDQFNVYDNTEADKLNCTESDHTQWTYNAGTLLAGAAYMYNYTNGSTLWEQRINGIISRTATVMFPNGIMTEVCEESGLCNTDQHSFKAYLSRWMALTVQLAPFTYTTIMNLLKPNAKAAVAQCTGTSTGPAAGFNIGTACGLKWNSATWDGSDGVGQQMAALEVLLSTLIEQTEAPLTTANGGTSTSNPNAGSGNTALQNLEDLPQTTQKDRVGAGFVTAIILIVGISAMVFLFTDAWEHKERLEGALAANRTATALSEKEKWVEKKRSVQVLGMLGETGESRPPTGHSMPREPMPLVYSSRKSKNFDGANEHQIEEESDRSISNRNSMVISQHEPVDEATIGLASSHPRGPSRSMEHLPYSRSSVHEPTPRPATSGGPATRT